MTAKQRLFIKEYLLDLNATQAAIRAGYSKKTAAVIGQENLIKPYIEAEIEKELQKREKRIEVTQDMVINELRRIAFARIDNYLKFNHTGVELKDSSELSEDQLAAIESVSEMLTNAGGYVKFKLVSKEKALELLGNHLGMWKERQSHEFPDFETFELPALMTPEMAKGKGGNGGNGGHTD